MLHWAKFMDSVKITDGNKCQKMRKSEKLIKPMLEIGDGYELGITTE